MCKLNIRSFVAGLVIAVVSGAEVFAQTPQSCPGRTENALLKSEASNLVEREIAARAEERAETLRARLFDLQIEELELQARIEDLNYRLTPEAIQRSLWLATSVRPMDELREALRLRLENEKARVNKQLDLLASRREKLEAAVREVELEAARER
jgi:hypothetical protein